MPLRSRVPVLAALALATACVSPALAGGDSRPVGATKANLAVSDPVPAEDFGRVAAHAIERLGGEALATVADASLSDDERKRRLRAMLARELDIEALARFALARSWRRAGPSDRAAYVDAFADYIVARYGTVLDGAGDVRRFAVLGAHPAGGRDALVATRLDLADGRTMSVAWRMREVAGTAKILDIVVEGLSAAQTLRQEFAAVLRANDGRMAALIAILRQRSG